MTRSIALLVEDDPFWMEEISTALSDEGVEVLQATNADQALALFRANPTASLILDIILPETDGIEIITTLRAVAADVRILAVSGGGRLGAEFYLRLATSLGAVSSLEKPFTADQLKAAWRELVR